jgi:hypothetical protein
MLQEVSQTWSRIAHQTLEARFRCKWGVGEVCIQPPSPKAFMTAKLHNFTFAISLRPHDSIPAIALRHSCTVADLKRLNNIVGSDHILASRHYLLLPGS